MVSEQRALIESLRESSAGNPLADKLDRKAFKNDAKARDLRRLVKSLQATVAALQTNAHAAETPNNALVTAELSDDLSVFLADNNNGGDGDGVDEFEF